MIYDLFCLIAEQVTMAKDPLMLEPTVREGSECSNAIVKSPFEGCCAGVM